MQSLSQVDAKRWKNQKTRWQPKWKNYKHLPFALHVLMRYKKELQGRALLHCGARHAQRRMRRMDGSCIRLGYEAEYQEVSWMLIVISEYQ